MKKLATYDTIKKIVKYMKVNFIRTSDPIFRQPSTAYAVGSIAYHASLPTGYYLECTGTGGTTSAGDLVIKSPNVGATVTDGTVTWTIRAVASTADIPAPVDISGKANVSLNNLSAAGEAKIRAVSPRYLTNSYYNATTGDWYRVYSDGWVEQGGFPAKGTNGIHTVNLLKPMADTKYFIAKTFVTTNTSTGNPSVQNYRSKTTTSFNVYTDVNIADNNFAWYACGMGANR